ncbi:coiled-coil domain-containing protein 32 [Narcine bancroftii]|uniref:coiled-coil domain-containing protein 32 n=1 Tax=Narcine bancroftii TaxID=1343680 RepID=UPI00383202C4
MAASVTESTDDIWKRICSGLPAQMMDMNDTGSLMKECFPESFSEIFSPIPITDADLTNNNNLADGINSWAPMADSQQYLATLENRLRKLKGMNEEPSSKGMLRSLSQAKKECWDRFLHEQYMSETYSDGYEMDPSAMDYLKRWVQPDRVPVNTEEVQYLISPEGRSETQDEPEGPFTGEEALPETVWHHCLGLMQGILNQLPVGGDEGSYSVKHQNHVSMKSLLLSAPESD